MTILKKILLLPRFNKQLIVLINDIIISIIISIGVGLYLLEFKEFQNIINLIIIILVSFSFIPFFVAFGMYRIIFRYYGINSVVNIFVAVTFHFLIILTILYFLNFSSIPLEFATIQSIFFYIFINFNRLIISFVINSFLNQFDTNNSLIYGAGDSGVEIIKLLHDYNVIGFIDDDINKIGNTIKDKKIYSIENALKIIKTNKITDILIAIPNLSIQGKRKIFNQFEDTDLRIKFLPRINDIAKGDLNLSDLNKISIFDILQRKINLNIEDIKNKIKNKSILVTGSGGSIGSELCRQLIDYEPKKIILIDNNEYSLYKIDNEIKEILNSKNYITIHKSYLSDVCDLDNVNEIFKNNHPDIIFHAAAYKHVPLLETNIIQAIKNNVFGTLNILKLSKKYNASQFILISTDKAVRPENIMGATKRISEICTLLNNFNASNNGTIYTIIRFGNVLGSNGSVLPLFNYQISNGGPITLTDKEVTRYFMSIPEAVGLVLQSTSLSQGGEVFVLNMGKPLKIIDLARKMIKLYGLTEKNNDNIKGDIEIKIIGLRPGEKMHEELLIGKNPTNTAHPDIMMALENIPNKDNFQNIISSLEEYTKNNDIDEIIKLLNKNIEGMEKYKKKL